MAFCVTNAVLFPSSVCELMHNMAHIPVLVFYLLQLLNPHVWDGHGQTMGESNSSIFVAPAKGWKPGNIFCDQNGFRVDVFGEEISDHQVSNGIIIQVFLIKILMVLSCEAIIDSVMLVQH